MIDDNGILRESTAEDEKFLQEVFGDLSPLPPKPSPAEQISELKAELDALTAGYKEGVNEV